MRQEIQGLRAVAVLLVVLFHLWPHRMPGGYIGVDVFFVICGFLITSHLMREVDRTGSVSLTQFWARRIRRLLPASYLVLAGLGRRRAVFVPRLVWQQFFGEILGGRAVRRELVARANSVDYLAAENTPSPAQHYWTLSAEEQFYLVWPLLVLLGIWLARRRVAQTRRWLDHREARSSPSGARRPPRRWPTRCGSPPPTRPGPTSSRRHAPGSSVPARCWRSHRLLPDRCRPAPGRARLGRAGRAAGVRAGLRRDDPDARHRRALGGGRLGGADLGGGPAGRRGRTPGC